MRTLLSLPVRLGGLGIINPSLTSDYHFSSSVMIIDPAGFLNSSTYPVTAMTEILQRKVHVRNGRKTVLSNMAQELHSSLPKSLQRCLDVASEKGASTWLTALPFLWRNMVSYSIRGHLEMLFALDMAGDLLIYHHIVFVGGNSLLIIHLTANVEDIRTLDTTKLEILRLILLLKFVTMFSLNLLPLQQLSGEIMSLQSANVQDEARLDISADEFWGCSHQRAFFDVRIFNPFARTCQFPIIYLP